MPRGYRVAAGLAVFVVPGGSKAPDVGRITVVCSRRSPPVNKARFVPAERAHFWAPKLRAPGIAPAGQQLAGAFRCWPTAGAWRPHNAPSRPHAP
jgi:hypothetical protein